MRVRASCLFIMLVACGHPKTAAERCRMSNAFGRIGQEQNRVANAIEDARCDQIEAQERAEAREDAREKQVADEQRAASNRKLDAYLAEIRRTPRAPELGATLAEAKASCEQQRGSFDTKGSSLSCKVGGPAIFSGMFETGRIVQMDVFYEGADIAESRRTMEKTLGPFEYERVTPDGFRAFMWKGAAIMLVGYQGGVRLSMVASSPQ